MSTTTEKPWEVTKTIAYTGKVVVPSDRPGGKPYVYHFTREDFEQAARTANAKVRAGWNIPLCWEHQDVVPDKLRLSEQGRADRDFALGVFGKGAEFEVSGDGRRLLARLRGRNPKDLEQFKNVEFVSPEIQWDWTDTDGKTWHGPVITHIAATPRPVQPHQESVLESLRGEYRSSPSNFQQVRMSQTGKSVGSKILPSATTTRHLPRLRLSLSNYVKKETAMDPLDDKVTSDVDELDTEMETETESEDKPKDGGKDKKGSPWQRIADALSQHCGLQLGDVSGVTSPEELAQLIEVAGLNYTAGDEDGDEEDSMLDDAEPTGDMQQPPVGAMEASPPPVQMSLKAQQDEALVYARRNLAQRVKSLRNSRRVPPHKAESLEKEVKTVRLSFGKGGKLVSNSLIAKIEAYEDLDPNHAWRPRASRKEQAIKGKGSGKKARLSQRGSAVKEADDSRYRERSPDDDEAVVAAVFEMAGRSSGPAS